MKLPSAPASLAMALVLGIAGAFASALPLAAGCDPRPDLARPEQAKPDLARPDQARPDQAKPGKAAPEQPEASRESHALARDLPADLMLRLKPLERPGRHIGGCFPGRHPDQGPRAWGRATQGSAWDPFDGVYYTLAARRDGAEAMRVMTWGDREQDRVFVADTKWEFGRFPHQGLALYRPAKDAPVRFFAQASVFEGKDRKAEAKAFVLNLLEWQKDRGAMAVAGSWTLFDAATHAPCQMNACLSPDGQTLVCRARRLADGVWVFGVWKTAALFAALEAKGAGAGPVDATGLAERVFASPWGTRNVALQSLATDGRLLYGLTSPADLKPHQIFVMDLHGRKVLERRPSFEGFEIEPRFHKRCVEAEGLFFARVAGELRLVMDVSLAVYDRPDENGMPSLKWTRINHYYVLF